MNSNPLVWMRSFLLYGNQCMLVLNVQESAGKPNGQKLQVAIPGSGYDNPDNSLKTWMPHDQGFSLQENLFDDMSNNQSAH
jgi:hypothetical protein